MKVLILGNCGCGKSYLANKLSLKTGIISVNLDKIMWIPESDIFRNDKDIKKDLDNVIKMDSYIVEGVWGIVMEYLIKNDNIDLLIFLEIDLEECKYNILNRISDEENGSLSYEERMRIVKYAQNYYLEYDDCDFDVIFNNLTILEQELFNQFNIDLHTNIYNSFITNNKIYLKNKNDINKFIDEF